MAYKGFFWAGLTMEDLGEAIAFYRDVLELPLTHQSEHAAHFDVKGALLELSSGGKASSEPKSTEQQPIIPGFRLTDFGAAVSALEDRGVTFIPKTKGEWEGIHWIRFADPEGNQIQISGKMKESNENRADPWSSPESSAKVAAA